MLIDSIIGEIEKNFINSTKNDVIPAFTVACRKTGVFGKLLHK